MVVMTHHDDHRTQGATNGTDEVINTDEVTLTKETTKYPQRYNHTTDEGIDMYNSTSILICTEIFCSSLMMVEEINKVENKEEKIKAKKCQVGKEKELK